MTKRDDGAPEYLLEEIEQLGSRKNYEEVVRRCTELQTSYPKQFEFHYFRAQANNYLGKISDALLDISRAIDLQKNEPALFFFRGTWSIDAGDLSGGVRDLEQAILLEQDTDEQYYSESARFARAVACVKIGDFAQALSDLEECRPDMDIYICGRLWQANEVRALARKGRP